MTPLTGRNLKQDQACMGDPLLGREGEKRRKCEGGGRKCKGNALKNGPHTFLEKQIRNECVLSVTFSVFAKVVNICETLSLISESIYSSKVPLMSVFFHFLKNRSTWVADVSLAPAVVLIVKRNYPVLCPNLSAYRLTWLPKTSQIVLVMMEKRRETSGQGHPWRLARRAA